MLGILLAVGAGVLAWRRPVGPAGATFDVVGAGELAAFLTFVLLGALVTWRRPEHPVGWLMEGLGLAVLLQQASQEYALAGAADGAMLVGRDFAAWVATWSVPPPLALLVVLLLWFPTGRPSSWRWQVVSRVVVGLGAVVTVGWATWAWRVRDLLLTDGADVTRPGLLAGGVLVLAAGVPLAMLALLVRYRTADPDTRRQLRWLLLAAVGLVVAAVVGVAAELLDAGSRATDALGSLSIAGVAAAIAVAILRHHLYEIDRILARTVSWLLVTMALAATYVGSVLVARALLEPVAPDSPLAVALSTLLVAAAFGPVRARTQLAVDRRFNRAHHDRELVVTSFATRLTRHDQLDTLGTDLLATTHAIVEPAHASLWLPAPPTTRPRSLTPHPTVEGPDHATHTTTIGA